MDYHKKLKQLRKELKMSQAVLALKMNSNQSEIARIESGKANPKVKTLAKYAKALHRDLVIDFPEKISSLLSKSIPAKD